MPYSCLNAGDAVEDGDHQIDTSNAIKISCQITGEKNMSALAQTLFVAQTMFEHQTTNPVLQIFD